MTAGAAVAADVPRPRARRSGRRRAGLRALAGIEARRLARHPLFLVGTALLAVVTAATRADSADLLVWPFLPALFLGLVGIVATARLTRSTEVLGDAVLVAPVPETVRTSALCLACVVPTAVAAAWVAVIFAATAVWPPDPRAWWFGTMPATDVISIMVASSVVAVLGGGLLGVAVGRWLRFPGAQLLCIVLLIAVGQVSIVAPTPLSLLSPWRMWHDNTASDGSARLYPGAPLWHGVYQVLLCGLAAAAALSRDAHRRRLVRWVGVGLVVLAAAAYALALTTGNEEIRISPVIPAAD